MFPEWLLSGKQNQSFGRRTQQKRLRKGASARVLKELSHHLEPPATPDEHAPVRRARRYLDRRKEHLDSPAPLPKTCPLAPA
jgi:hypothetical protein